VQVIELAVLGFMAYSTASVSVRMGYVNSMIVNMETNDAVRPTQSN
jgi:hypothetical protein